MKPVIVHCIARDKFTTGYINFMKLRMLEWEHHFFVAASGFYEVKPVDEHNIHYYDDAKKLNTPDNLLLLKDCRKIIISGIWDTRLLLMLERDFVRKTYMQFWGGDFYGYRFSRIPGLRHPRGSLKWFIRRYLHHRFIKKCAGTISLINDDIDELQKIFPSSVKHFTAQMPGDVLEHHDFDSLSSLKHEGSALRILAGNSAQRPNAHKGIFEKLAHLKDADIEIYSPLSYGDSDYRDGVIKLGHKIFGDKFKPIVDFMSKTDYVKFLASCDVAVFNYNQQAALGNIWFMLRLGKKVYIRKGTSMWRYLVDEMKYVLYPVSELDDITINQLADFPQEQALNNIRIIEECASRNLAVEQWRKVFED